MGKKPTAGESAKKTPPKFKQYKDGRKNKGAGTYPNAWRRKTRSGHLFEIDDSKDAETITIQHRGGSMIQFLPDGAVHYTSFNGQQHVTFGENRVYVSGAHDLVVEGDFSNKTKGDYNDTVEGGRYSTTNGPSVVAAKSHSAFYEGHNDVMSESSSTEVSKSMSVKAGEQLRISAQKGAVMGSDSSGMALSGATAGLKGREGVGIESVGYVHVQGGREVAMDAAEIHFNSGKSRFIKDIVKLG